MVPTTLLKEQGYVVLISPIVLRPLTQKHVADSTKWTPSKDGHIFALQIVLFLRNLTAQNG